MKKLAVAAVSLTLLLTVFLPVLAENNQQGRGQEVRQLVASRVAEHQEEVQEHVQGLRNRSQELREQRRAERTERQATRRAEIASKVAELRTRVIEHIKKVFSRILDRTMAALDRLNKIVDRINSRIAKLKSKGVNTSAAETALANCNNNQKVAAVAAIADAKAKVAAIDSSSANVRDAVHTANSAMRAAKRALHEYHKCLVEVTRMLKAASPKEATGSATDSAR